MKAVTVVGMLAAGAIWTGGCAKGPDARTSTPPPQQASPAQTSGAAARDLCALLSSSEVTEITGLAIERAEKKPDGCEWYANAAARQQKGADTVRSTFEKLSKEEPKSADEGMRAMENLLKGASTVVTPDKPLFGVSAQWENADQAEAILKGTVGAIGGGLPGGRLEPIEGLGDRAYMGPAGSFFYVRKGPALLTFGWSLGTREQAIALAQRIVSRL